LKCLNMNVFPKFEIRTYIIFWNPNVFWILESNNLRRLYIFSNLQTWKIMKIYRNFKKLIKTQEIDTERILWNRKRIMNFQ
jgi:hypothetical protein